MMTNGDHQGRIFLSHPHTNNRFFFLLTTKYLILYFFQHEKDFQKILNKLRCDMGTSFKHYDITDQNAASMRLTSVGRCVEIWAPVGFFG